MVIGDDLETSPDGEESDDSPDAPGCDPEGPAVLELIAA